MRGVHHASELVAENVDLRVAQDADAGKIAALVKERELVGRQRDARPFAERAQRLVDFGEVADHADERITRMKRKLNAVC